MKNIKAILAIAALVLLAVMAVAAYGYWRDQQNEARAVALAEAKRNAEVVAAMADALEDARRTASRVDTVLTSILVRPLPPRPVVQHDTVLITLAPDSLVGIIHAQAKHIDTLTSRYAELQSAANDFQMAHRRYSVLADSTISTQSRQIRAMQVVIDTPKPRRRWGIGGTCGRSIVVSGENDWGCTMGVSYAVF